MGKGGGTIRVWGAQVLLQVQAMSCLPVQEKYTGLVDALRRIPRREGILVSFRLPCSLLMWYPGKCKRKAGMHRLQVVLPASVSGFGAASQAGAARSFCPLFHIGCSASGILSQDDEQQRQA